MSQTKMQAVTSTPLVENRVLPPILSPPDNDTESSMEYNDNNNGSVSDVAFGSRNSSTRKKAVTLSRRSGLVFPVGRIRRYLKTNKHTNRISVGSAVYCTAVLEYLVAEVMELASNAAQENNRMRITPRHLTLAIRNDEELARLVGNQTIIAGGGVMPHIHEVLLPVRSTSRLTQAKQK